MHGDGEIRVRPPEEIRAEIERARSRIARSARALRKEVEARVDWRGWVRKRPVLFVASAVAVGVWLGTRRR